MFNPAHPAELIRETIEGRVEETGSNLSIDQVANGLGNIRKNLFATINDKQSVTPEMAIKLSTSFTNTAAEFWLEVQNNYNLFIARKKVDTKNIQVFWEAAVL